MADFFIYCLYPWKVFGVCPVAICGKTTSPQSLNVISVNKLLERLPVGIADRQNNRSDLDFVLVNGVDGLQGNDVGIVNTDKLVLRKRFLERLQSLEAHYFLQSRVNGHIIFQTFDVKDIVPPDLYQFGSVFDKNKRLNGFVNRLFTIG